MGKNASNLMRTASFLAPEFGSRTPRRRTWEAANGEDARQPAAIPTRYRSDRAWTIDM